MIVSLLSKQNFLIAQKNNISCMYVSTCVHIWTSHHVTDEERITCAFEKNSINRLRHVNRLISCDT